MVDTIAMIIAIVIVIGGVIWAVWYENFAGRDAKPKETKTEGTNMEQNESF